MGWREFHPPLPVEKSRILFFTGHRPIKLPKDPGLMAAVLKTLHHYIDRMLAETEYRCFMTGMADGIDYFATEYLIQKKREYPEIFIISVEPCYGYYAYYVSHGYESWRLEVMREGVDLVLTIPEVGITRSTFLDRNSWMAMHSGAVIGVVDDSSPRSGSGAAVRYARKNGSRYWVLDPFPPRWQSLTPENWPAKGDLF